LSIHLPNTCLMSRLHVVPFCGKTSTHGFHDIILQRWLLLSIVTTKNALIRLLLQETANRHLGDGGTNRQADIVADRHQWMLLLSTSDESNLLECNSVSFSCLQYLFCRFVVVLHATVNLEPKQWHTTIRVL
jgi:hypothetical protein